jgi:MFS family permease
VNLSAHRGLIAACALGMGVSWNITNVGALAEPIADQYGVSLASLALLTSALFLSEAMTSIPAGRIADRLGPRRLGIACLVITAVGNLGLAFAGSLEPALLLRLVTGVGVGCGFLAGAAYVSGLGGSPLAQGVYGSMSMAAGGLALAILPVLEGPLGWQAAYLSGTAAALLALVVFVPAPEQPASTLPPPTSGALLRDPRIIRFACVQGAVFGLSVALSASIVPLLEERGVSSETAGVAVSLIFFTGIAGRPLSGALINRWPERTRAIVGGGMILGALGTVCLGIATPVPFAIAGGILVGLASGVPFPATMTGLAREFPASVGSAFGTMNFYVILGVIVGTPLLSLALSVRSDGLVGICAVAALWAAAVFAFPKSATGRSVPAYARSLR